MKNNNLIHQIVLTGIFCSIGILVGAFAHFPIFKSSSYLVGIVVFTFPFILKFPFLMIGTNITIFFTDLTTGWLFGSWISMIAYSLGVIIIWLFYKFANNNLIFLALSLALASATITTIYFLLEMLVWDVSYAISDLWATMIQFSIVVPISLLIIPMVNKIKKHYI